MHVFDVDIAETSRKAASSIAMIVVSQSENPGPSYLKVSDPDILYVSPAVKVAL
jgi:hypothetical protein